jgi:DNA-binding GntR family transcriptional regulator
MTSAKAVRAGNSAFSLAAEPLHLQAARHLRAMIIEGRLPPNSPIDERSLCQQFGTSRTPLREALKVLATEGLIELLPRRGAVVADISEEDMHEKFAVVRVLEAYAARVVCMNATQAQIDELMAIHGDLMASHKKRNHARYFELNEKFHRGIVAAAGNKTLIDIHSSLVDHLRRARMAVLSAEASIPQFVKHHERIAKAIRDRNADLAALEFTKHQEAVEQKTISLKHSQHFKHS